MRNVSLAVALFSLAECTHGVDLSGTTGASAAVAGRSAAPVIAVSTSPIRINEVVPRANGSDGWVELFNPTASTIQLTDWTITSADVSRAFTLPPGASIPPRGFLVIDEASVPAGLGATGTVNLFSPFGFPIDTFSWSQIRDTDYGRCPDGDGDFLIIESTQGAPNACPLGEGVATRRTHADAGPAWHS